MGVDRRGVKGGKFGGEYDQKTLCESGKVVEAVFFFYINEEKIILYGRKKKGEGES